MCVAEEEILKLATGTSVPHQRRCCGWKEVRFIVSVFLLESVSDSLQMPVGNTLSVKISLDFHREINNFSVFT